MLESNDKPFLDHATPNDARLNIGNDAIASTPKQKRQWVNPQLICLAVSDTENAYGPNGDGGGNVLASFQS